MVIVLALATVVPTAIVGGLSIQRARSDLEREVVRGNLALIRALGATLDERLQGGRRSLEHAAAFWADGRTSSTRGGGEAAERMLRRLRRETPFARLSITDVDGNHLHGDEVTVDASTGAHSFGSYVGDVSFEDGRPLVQLAAQARSRTGELVGIFVAQLDVQFIADALAVARLGSGARLIVVDNKGVPVARSDGNVAEAETSLRGENPAVDRALGSAIEGSMHHNGVVSVYRNLSGFQGLRGVAWSIIVEQPERDAYALARATARTTVVAAILSLLIAFLAGVLLATRLTGPLHDLAARADAIAGDHDHGDWSTPRPPIVAPAEIGVLAQRIEEMAQRLGERDRLQEALARGDRLASVGTMAASIAHEINNPLTTVLGFAKLLLEDKPENHPEREALILIVEESERMKRNIGSLLNYSRSESAPTSTELANVNTILRRTVALLAVSLKRHTVTLDLEPSLPNAAAEVYALQQVFVNLIKNATQAMPESGNITLVSRRQGKAIQVLVKDEGDGIAVVDRERVFETFYTTKAPGAGTGLGLALCRYLLSKIHATIEVVGSEQGGACFQVTLPIVD